MTVYKLYSPSGGYDYLITNASWRPMCIDAYWAFETLGM